MDAPLVTPPPTAGRLALGATMRTFFAEALLFPTGFVTMVVLTRQLGPSDYGIFTLVSMVIAWIEWSLAALFSRAAIKLIGETPDWRPLAARVLQLTLGLSLAVTALLWLLAGPLAALFHEPALAGALRLFALDIPLFALSYAHRSILAGIGQYALRARASAVRWLTRMVLVVALVELGLSVTGAILGCLGASLLELLVASRYRPPSPFTRTGVPLRALTGYVVPLFLFSIAIRLVDKLDLFVLKALGGTASQAGVYGAAQNVALLPGVITLAFSPLLLSALTRLEQSGGDTRGLSRDAMRLTTLLLPFALLGSGAAGEIVELLFGPVFRPGAPILALLLIAATGNAMISVTTAILTAAGRPRWTMAITLPLLPLAVAGHLLAIPRWGAPGAAAVTALCLVGGAVTGIVAVRRRWGAALPAATILRAGLVSALAYGGAIAWPATGGLVVVKLAVLSGLVALGLTLLGEFDARERALLRSLFRLPPRAAAPQRI
ncbi:MAG: lipopolysaccharide biosynthesis protein [Gemmatimonadota bacterium]